MSSIVGVRIAPEAGTKNSVFVPITVSLEKFNGILVYAYYTELTLLKKIISSGPVWDHQFINATEVALLQAKGQESFKMKLWRFQFTKKPINFCPRSNPKNKDTELC